ncbi:hypothetical protein DFH94DRAFT_148892 [Russula ochroleuca]|uniref:Secreted protein n=1 Tax=Russula ochroleuca TaxID=152965 RepID=A0A9P5JZ49_9AGAM|nr:hypothetical protein DFH94DRAFT_148892 [Russula ochroleuca]
MRARQRMMWQRAWIMCACARRVGAAARAACRPSLRTTSMAAGMSSWRTVCLETLTAPGCGFCECLAGTRRAGPARRHKSVVGGHDRKISRCRRSAWSAMGKRVNGGRTRPVGYAPMTLQRQFGLVNVKVLAGPEEKSELSYIRPRVTPRRCMWLRASTSWAT